MKRFQQQNKREENRAKKQALVIFKMVTELYNNRVWTSDFANNKGADQPAHPRRLISAFVVHFWKVSYLN